MFLFSEIYFAICEEINFVRPFVVDAETKACYDVFSNAIIGEGEPGLVFSKKFLNFDFKIENAPFVYATEIRTNEKLSENFKTLPCENVGEDYLSFCGKVFLESKKVKVSLDDLIIIVEVIKKNRNLKEELI